MSPARGRMARQETTKTQVGEAWVEPIQRATGTKMRKARTRFLPVNKDFGPALGRGAGQGARRAARRGVGRIGHGLAGGGRGPVRPPTIACGLAGVLLVLPRLLGRWSCPG